MKPLARIAWIVVFLLYVAAVAWLCFGNIEPGENIPRAILGIPIDQCVHFTMFLPFPILCTLAFRDRSWWRALCWATLTANIIAIVFESQQHVINPYRYTQASDLVANLMGITVGLLIMAVIGIVTHKK
jgi:VanZ family protein